MLDGEHSIVAHRPQCRYEVGPEGCSVTVPERSISPYKIAHRFSWLQIQRSLHSQIVRFNPRVLGVDISNGSVKAADNRYGIHSLKKEMTGIQVSGDDR